MILHISFLLLALLLTLYSTRRLILRALARFLVVDDCRRPCDAIVLLNGNISTRTYRAVELYKRNRTPILMARLADTEEVRLGVIPNISDATRDLLSRLGVSEIDITVLSSDHWVAGTWAEAIILCAHIRARAYRTVAIVTDAFHTRRARWTLRKVMRDDNVEFFCAATPYSLGLTDQWWRSEYGVVNVIIEYIKFAHYQRMQHGVKRRPPPSETDLPPADETRRFVSGYAAGKHGHEHESD